MNTNAASWEHARILATSFCSDYFITFQESLFYTVPPGAMPAYRESLESLSVHHKVKRSFMHTTQDLVIIVWLVLSSLPVRDFCFVESQFALPILSEQLAKELRQFILL